MVDFLVQLVMTINCLVHENLLKLLKEKSCNSVEEICGFLIKTSDKFDFFIECQNLHPDSSNYFLISPKEYIWDKECILFHSHPKHAILDGFSDWDLENQKYFALDMLLYSVNKDKFYISLYD